MRSYGSHPHTQEKPVLVKEAMARFTTDVIASCAFGVEANALTDANSEFRTTTRKIFNFSICRYIFMNLAFFMPGFVKLFKTRVMDREIDEFVRRTLWTVVAHRQKKGEIRNDFVDLLMQIKKNNEEQDVSGFELEGDDFVAQAFVFIAAGIETSTLTITFCLYELARNPEVQAELRREILAVLAEHGGKFCYDAMMKMTYLDMVVSETLRKYPPLPFLERKCQRNYTIPGTAHVIEKNVGVFISLLGLHYDPRFFPDPEKFMPERFSAENCQNSKHAFMPFGEGPRKCIGMRLGLMQVKTALVYTLKEFEVHRCNNTLDNIEFMVYTVSLAPKDDMPLLLTRVK